jgi:CheY-like chemotaxis protein
VLQWSSDITCGGDASMVRARVTLVVADLRGGQLLFSSGTLSRTELAPLQPFLVQVAAARRVGDDTVAPGTLPTFDAPRESIETPTVCRLVHVDLDRQVALWELESRVGSAAAPEPAIDAWDHRPRLDGPPRIVCVDNDPDGLEVLRFTLSSLPGVQFAAATTGHDGLALLHEVQPSVLLVDLQLPDISGVTVVEICRRSAAFASMPVVVLTADAAMATRRAIEALGVAHLAIKPFDLVELRAVVERLLDRR